MNEDFNYNCDQFKKNLENLINNSNLPIAAIYFILKDIYNEVEKLNIAYLNDLTLKQSKKLEKQIDENKDFESIKEDQSVQMVPIQN